MAKQKKCKGTGKAKGHGCGEIRFLYRYGLCQFCFRTWLLKTPEGAEVLNRSQIRAKKDVAKINQEKDRQAKVNIKTIAELLHEAKAPFQKLIRIRDHGGICICCERRLPFNIGDFDAGHYYSAESHRGLIFHPHNVNGQRKYCNKYLYGNESGYAIGLTKKIGEEDFNKLKDLRDELRNYEWDKFKLIEMRNYYAKELRQVEKGEKDIKDVDFSIGIITLF